MVSGAWPGLARFENDTKATNYFFIYVFACLSKCSAWNSLQGNWEALVLIHIGDDSEKCLSLEKATCM